MKLNYRFLIYLSFFSLVLFLLIFKIIDVSLKHYTRHHKAIYVPSLIGLNLESTKDTLKKYDLNFIIIDSAAYNPNYNRGSIVSHNPKEGAEVKPGRKIYLTINPLTIHYIPFPNLENKSLRQGMALLENSAFRIGQLYYINDFARDVIRFSKVDSEKVNRNDSLPKFTIVDLYLGNGHNQEVLVPNIVGLQFNQIKKRLNTNSLNLGKYHINDSISDTLKSIIYRQNPGEHEKVPLGSHISIWLKDSLINTSK